MSESFRAATGRKVISRASAQELGKVAHLVVDVERGRIAAVVMGRGRKAAVIEWAHLSGFGPDAVMVVDEDALRAAGDERERAAADGKLELVGRRALSDQGNELGKVDDVTFDPDSGNLEELLVGDRRFPAGALLGSGSYAAVLGGAEV